MRHTLTTAIVLLAACTPAPSPPPPASPPGVAPAVANDNRVAAGTERRGVRTVHLEARLAAWRPDLDVDSAMTVQAFAEAGGAPRIPGPLLRVREGDELRVTVRNSIPDSTLVVHGLRAGTAADDTIAVAPGAVRELRVTAGAPGTYLYWGTTTGSVLGVRWDRDAQLTGAIVVDPRGAAPDTAERVFVMTTTDVYPDSSDPRRQGTKDDAWEIAINGRSWPHTERLAHAVGDTVRWRWLNGTYRSHPMHLHGFHFAVTARGNGRADTSYAAGTEQHVVTEMVPVGGTMAMRWTPTRAGHWLFHCHMAAHMTPWPPRPDSVRHHPGHEPAEPAEPAEHATRAMAGLVLGIAVADRRGATVPHDSLPPSTLPPPLRLLVQERPGVVGGPVPRGFVLQRGAEPRRDSIEIPGTPLVVERGRPVAVTVVNRLREPTTVHWHGMELRSVYDGVSGWSGLDAQRAPLLAPGDSFTVWFAPPRAGTYIYHTHMDEEAQLGAGLYGALLVVEPGATPDPETDRTFVLGGLPGRPEPVPALNGHRAPPPLTLRAGTTYRLRLVNILPVVPARVALLAGGDTATWRAHAKDGADLPPSRRVDVPARLSIGVGETYDFLWTPRAAGDAVLELHPAEAKAPIRQLLRVVPADARAARSTTR